jgi:hypothetical protein
MEHQVNAQCIWTLKEKRNGIYVPRLRKKNLITSYGLNNLAGAWSGTLNPPYYLVIDSTNGTVNATTGPGSPTIVLNSDPTAAGDTQLVLSVGMSNQEVVTFSSKSGTGPFTYNLTANTAQTHYINDPCTRQPTPSDTMGVIMNPVQYDSVNYPNEWENWQGGYAQGVGNWTLQFYIPAAQALAFFGTLGLSDNIAFGQGNLHALLAFGYDHSQGVSDVEIDASLTITNT